LSHGIPDRTAVFQLEFDYKSASSVFRVAAAAFRADWDAMRSVPSPNLAGQDSSCAPRD
jgi:hypothetical protein